MNFGDFGKAAQRAASSLLPAVEKYTAAELKLQDTVGPTVASYFGGEWAGRGASFWQKEYHQFLSPDEKLAVSNPGVGVPLKFLRVTAGE